MACSAAMQEMSAEALDYEAERVRRIAENKMRLDALVKPALANCQAYIEQRKPKGAFGRPRKTELVQQAVFVRRSARNEGRDPVNYNEADLDAKIRQQAIVVFKRHRITISDRICTFASIRSTACFWQPWRDRASTKAVDAALGAGKAKADELRDSVAACVSVRVMYPSIVAGGFWCQVPDASAMQGLVGREKRDIKLKTVYDSRFDTSLPGHAHSKPLDVDRVAAASGGNSGSSGKGDTGADGSGSTGIGGADGSGRSDNGGGADGSGVTQPATMDGCNPPPVGSHYMGDDGQWDVVWLPHGKATVGLSGGWRGYAIDHELCVDDVAVLHAVTATRFDVYLYRAYSYQAMYNHLESPPDSWLKRIAEEEGLEVAAAAEGTGEEGQGKGLDGAAAQQQPLHSAGGQQQAESEQEHDERPRKRSKASEDKTSKDKISKDKARDKRQGAAKPTAAPANTAGAQAGISAARHGPAPAPASTRMAGAAAGSKARDTAAAAAVRPGADDMAEGGVRRSARAGSREEQQQPAGTSAAGVPAAAGRQQQMRQLQAQQGRSSAPQPSPAGRRAGRRGAAGSGSPAGAGGSGGGGGDGGGEDGGDGRSDGDAGGGQQGSALSLGEVAPDVFYVYSIVDYKVTRGKEKFLIRWWYYKEKGYPDTWESINCLNGDPSSYKWECDRPDKYCRRSKATKKP